MATEKHLVHNPDLALHESREHTHEHLHHSANAEKGRTDDVHYTRGTTDEPSIIPKPDVNDDYLHRHGHPERNNSNAGKDRLKYDEKDIKYDAEKGSVSPANTTGAEEADPQRHKVSRFYRKYRIVFHLFLVALFTGYVFAHNFSVLQDTHDIFIAGGSHLWFSTDMTRTGSSRSCYGSALSSASSSGIFQSPSSPSPCTGYGTTLVSGSMLSSQRS